MAKQAIKFSDENLYKVPEMLAEGMTRAQIAKVFGTTIASLQQKCSTKGISLRSPKSVGGNKLSYYIQCEIAIPHRKVICEYAKQNGMTEGELVSELMTMIAQDNMFSAVLDYNGDDK